jgi:hypothetical protein
MRWLILIALIWAVFTGWEGQAFKRAFRLSDRIAVSAVSVLSQIQLLLGFWLYMDSPVVKGFWADRSFHWNDSLFFALVHIGLMTTAIVLITIGSALAKKATEDRRKFNTVFTYYGIALLIVLLAIPWPFSPLAQRPFLRF